MIALISTLLGFLGDVPGVGWHYVSAIEYANGGTNTVYSNTVWQEGGLRFRWRM